MKPVYVSTGAFKSKYIEEILDVAYRNDIRHLELSSGILYHKRMEEIINSARNDFQFLIHNYFPTPRESFTLNLATDDAIAKKTSMEFCKRAIRMVHELGGTFYSVHCGFTFQGTGTELGNAGQLSLPRIPIALAKANFIDNLRELCRYAGQYDINIAIENNVVAEYAAHEKDLYLGVSTMELQEIIAAVQCDNLGILLDLAHAKVSNTFFNFGIDDMAQSLNEKIIAVHISENDGHFDQNRPLNINSELLGFLQQLKENFIVLEAYNLEPEMIKSQIQLISEAIQND